MLGGIDADDGKVLTAHFLDAGADDSVGLLQRLFAAWLGLGLLTTASSDVVHFGYSVIGESKGVNLKLSHTAIQAVAPPPKKYFGDLNRHTRA